MQTFLPYPDFEKCAKILDKRRAFKQVVEANQILNILLNRTQSKAWRNHPAVRMWTGYEDCLKQYYNVFYLYCKNQHNIKYKKLIPEDISFVGSQPVWLGKEELHESHRANLWRKALSDKDKGYFPLYNSLCDNLDFNSLAPQTEYIWP